MPSERLRVHRRRILIARWAMGYRSKTRVELFVNFSRIEILERKKSIRILRFNRSNIVSLGSRKKVVGAMGYRSAGVKEEVSIGGCHIWIFEQDSKKGGRR